MKNHKNKMSVLHFSNSYYPTRGGIENVIENLCIQLKRNKIKSDVLTLNVQQKKKLSKKELYKGHKIYRVPFLDLRYYKLSKVPFQIIKNYDIIHIHSLGFFSDLILASKFIHKKRMVVSTNGGFFHTNAIKNVKKLYFNSIERLLLKNADSIIAISPHDAEVFEKIVKKDKITVIEPGFDLPEPKGKKQKNTFLYVGRLSTNKGIDNLIETFSMLKSNYTLKIAGKDFDRILNQLKQKAKALGIEKKVEFLGELNDKQLQNEYSNAEYAVSASKYEGFGIAAIEAMHYKCICILNSIPTFTKFCAEGRGHIIDYSKHKEAAKKIEEIIGKHDEEKKEMINKAKNYSKQFLWKNKIKEFEKIYFSIL